MFLARFIQFSVNIVSRVVFHDQFFYPGHHRNIIKGKAGMEKKWGDVGAKSKFKGRKT
jgi:hypothetical protein